MIVTTNYNVSKYFCTIVGIYINLSTLFIALLPYKWSVCTTSFTECKEITNTQDGNVVTEICILKIQISSFHFVILKHKTKFYKYL